jgi:hypothetical protein
MNKFILAFIVSLLIFSCSQPEVSHSSLTDVSTNDILTFKSLDDFLSTADRVGHMKEGDFILWEKERNFTSRYSDYKQLLESDIPTISKNGLSIVYNDNDSTFTINSVSTNIAKITNRSGLVIIDGATYLFSADEVAVLAGSSIIEQNELIGRSARSKKVISKPVIEIGTPTNTARVAPWDTYQQGNDVKDVVRGSNNPCWLGTRLVGKAYDIPHPTSPWQTLPRQSINVLASFYHQKAFGGNELIVPQKFEVTWNFEAFYNPCPICPNQYNPISGSYVESGVPSIEITVFDGVRGDIKNLNIPVSASAYNTSGQTVVSATAFLFTN